MLPQRLLVGIAAYRQGNWTFDRLNNVGDANSRSGTGKHDSTACTARRTQQAGLRKNADKLLCGGKGQTGFGGKVGCRYARRAAMARSCAHDHHCIIGHIRQTHLAYPNQINSLRLGADGPFDRLNQAIKDSISRKLPLLGH